jgi:predicted metalloprotease
MTFNPNADIRSDNVSRGGGGGGRGRGLVLGGGGGGCLLLVIVVIYALIGGNPLDLLQGGGTGTTQGQQAQDSGETTECRTGADANESDDCLVQATIESADSAWAEIAPGMGIDFREPQARLFTGQTNTGCGAASKDVGPFYCPADATIYIDTSFYDDLSSTYGASDGSFAKEYVIAHEYGHHIQNLQGTMEHVDHSQSGPTSDGVRLELQADCYAGVWGSRAASSTDSGGQEFLEPLTDEDIADGLSAASAVGDDHIQGEVSGGQVSPETWTHGSSSQRQKWFTTGYESGDPASCDTFSTSDL